MLNKYGIKLGNRSVKAPDWEISQIHHTLNGALLFPFLLEERRGVADSEHSLVWIPCSGFAQKSSILTVPEWCRHISWTALVTFVACGALTWVDHFQGSPTSYLMPLNRTSWRNLPEDYLVASCWIPMDSVSQNCFRLSIRSSCSFVAWHSSLSPMIIKLETTFWSGFVGSLDGPDNNQPKLLLMAVGPLSPLITFPVTISQ